MTDNELLEQLDQDIITCAGICTPGIVDMIKAQAMEQIENMELPTSVLNDVCIQIIADLAYASILTNKKGVVNNE